MALGFSPEDARAWFDAVAKETKLPQSVSTISFKFLQNLKQMLDKILKQIADLQAVTVQVSAVDARFDLVGVDLLTAASLPIVTIPGGQTFIPKEVTVTITDAAGVTGNPVVGIGTAVGASNVFPTIEMLGATDAVYLTTFGWSVNNLAMSTGVGEGQAIYVYIETGAAGATLTATVTLRGFYL